MIPKVSYVFRGDFLKREQPRPTDGLKKKQTGNFQEILGKELANNENDKIRKR